MRDMPLAWPCRVTRESDGHYVVTPFSALQCARSGATLQAASDLAMVALSGYLEQSRRTDSHIEPPGIGHIPSEDLRAGCVIRVLVENHV